MQGSKKRMTARQKEWLRVEKELRDTCTKLHRVFRKIERKTNIFDMTLDMRDIEYTLVRVRSGVRIEFEDSTMTPEAKQFRTNLLAALGGPTARKSSLPKGGQ